MSIYIYIYICIHIYIERERERERDTRTHTHTYSLSLSIYIYIYIYSSPLAYSAILNQSASIASTFILDTVAAIPNSRVAIESVMLT